MIGKTISHFRILAKLGEGGMGVVYRAEDLRLGRPVALKVLRGTRAGDEEWRLRLIREARTAALLNHPNIASIHEVDEVDGVAFIAMEYLEGKTLRALLGGRALAIKEALRIATGIAEGLARAHGARVIHRDLKPENVAITPDGQVKILDFGLAKTLEQTGEASPEEPSRLETISVDRTREGRIVGTAAYMSPEQARGQALDTRSDLFSFGTVLYEMVTGRAPFQGATLVDALSAILREQATSAIDLNPEVPPELQRILGKCLEKEPAERYQDTRDLVVDLRRLMRETDSQPMRRAEVSAPRSVLVKRKAARLVAPAIMLPVLAAIAVPGWLAWRKWRGATVHRPEHVVRQRQLTAGPVENPIDAAAISPDGKLLAYVDQNELALLSIDTGEKRHLLEPDTTIYRIAWLPDGTRFLLDRGGSIWSYSILSGATRRLRDGAVLRAVSPDGSFVAFADETESELWIMGADGSAPRELVAAERVRSAPNWIGSVTWSPDSQRLAYVEVAPMADAASLESVDLQGKRTAILSEAGSPPIVSACWIADGRLLFSRSWQESTRSGNSLWGIPVDGRSGLPASAPEKISESAGFWWDRLSASADGKRLAFANCRDQGDVYLGELVGGGTRLSSPRRLTLDEREDLLGGWSRDGRWILFASDRSGSLDLFRQAPDSRSAESVFVGPDADGRPIMAPDGSSVLFVQSGDGSPQDLRLLRLPGDGGAPEIVLELDALTVRGVRCSTGSCVLAEKVEPGQLVFFALDPVRGKQGELARVEFRQSARMFRSWDVSPDGSQLALVEYDRPLRLVSLVDKRVREIPLGDWRSPQNVAWSHDGKSLFITGWAGNQMLLLRVDLDGRTTILWRQWPGFIFNLAPSPDGRYLAAGVRVVDSNVWLLEDF